MTTEGFRHLVVSGRGDLCSCITSRQALCTLAGARLSFFSSASSRFVKNEAERGLETHLCCDRPAFCQVSWHQVGGELDARK